MWNSLLKKNRRLDQLTAAALMGLWMMTPGWVQALPGGGDIVSGSGSIEQVTSQDMVIQQDSQQLIANWDSFSIGTAESVTFNQPNSSSIALNRVIGQDPSLILGKLSANGQIFLTNPSGVVFGQGAVVDVHGLLATTLNISDIDFLNNQYKLVQDSERPLAAIINQGSIKAVRYVGFAAPAIENSGTIVVADLGSVALASGTATTVDFNGDGLLSFTVTGEVSGVVTDTEGNVLEDRINNSGLIRAQGGQVLLTAKSAGDVIGNVVNHSGLIEAQSVQEVGGRIILSGGPSGVVNVSGTLDASGNDVGELGGTVHILGQQVGLFQTAVLNVSGQAGGGKALVGGDYQGAGDLPTSQATYVGEETQILADATVRGEGGTVVVWSDEITRVHGTISARGGDEGGNGGLVETSGRGGLEVTRNPDVGAPAGDGGLWLIDPDNIEIVEGDEVTRISDASPFEPTTGDARLGVDLILTAMMEGADVLITTGSEDARGDRRSGNITWNADLDYAGVGSREMTLSAHNDIVFNRSIFTSDPGAGDSLNLNLVADSDRNGAGAVRVAEDQRVMTHNGNINIQAHDLDLEGDLDSGEGDVLFILSDGGNLILASGNPAGANIGGDDLGHITAQNLIMSTEGNINVKGMTEDDTDGINGSVVLVSGRDINFEDEASVFPALELNAVNDINIEADITTTRGDFIAVADSEENTVGDFNLAPGVIIASARDIDVSGSSVNADDEAFHATRDLIINGDVVRDGPEPPVLLDTDSINQGSLSTFLSDFFENGGSGC